MNKLILLYLAILLTLVSLTACQSGGAPSSPLPAPTTTTEPTPTTTTTLAPRPIVTETPSSASSPAPKPAPVAPTLTPVPAPSPTLALPPAPTPTPAPASIMWTKPASPVKLTVNTTTNSAFYYSGSTQVTGFFYKPAGNGPFPAILVLHGKTDMNDRYRDYPQWLASRGYVAFAPDYFKPIGMTANSFTWETFEEKVDRVREDLGLGLEALKSEPYVDPNRIGVVGFSLGGYVSFIMDTRDDIKGVVSYFGAYPLVQKPGVARYPYSDIVSQMKGTVLMLHGDKDDTVPIANATQARDTLVSKGKQCELITYPGAGHSFNATGTPNYDASATSDAEKRTIAFFQANLR